MNDHELLIALKNGDLEAIEQVFALFDKTLLFFAWDLVGSKDDAENVVVETFVNLVQGGIKNNRTLSEIKKFLFTVARNHCLRLLKQAKTDSNITKETIYLLENSNDFIQTKIVRAEYLNLILNQMENLPPSK